MALHAAGGVHGVAPRVVAEPACPGCAGHHRAGVDADANLKGLTPGSERPATSSSIARAMSATASAWSLRGSGNADDHVGVTDGLDLLEPSLSGELVKAEKRSLSTSTTCSGVIRSLRLVKSTMSANSTVTSEVVGDHSLGLLEPGRDRIGTLRSSRSDFSARSAPGSCGSPRRGPGPRPAAPCLARCRRAPGAVVPGRPGSGTSGAPPNQAATPSDQLRMAGGPGGGERHRQRHCRADAGVVEQVVELEGRRRRDQDRHRPAPPDQHQAGDRKPADRRARREVAGVGRQANRDDHRDRDHQCQARVQNWSRDALSLPHRRHALVWKGHAGSPAGMSKPSLLPLCCSPRAWAARYEDDWSWPARVGGVFGVRLTCAVATPARSGR